MNRILYENHSTRGKLTANILVLTILIALIANTSAGIFAFAQTTNPISGAFVSASGDNGYGSATSNTQGNFNITSQLGTGNYTLDASATGFIDTTVENVAVTSGSEKSNVIINMDVSGGIAGRITDAVSSASLQFADVEAANRTGNVDYGSFAFTGSDGTYQITTNLATGKYNVTAGATGYLTGSLSNVAVTAGALTSNINIALSRSAVISGTVTDAVSGAPLSDVLVEAILSTGIFGDITITNSSGMYTLNTNLGTGIYNVTTFFPAGHISVTATGINVVAGNSYTQNLALPRSGRISGRITSPTGQGLADASVTAFASGGTSFGSATTNSTGYYNITDGLATGTYTLFASLGGGFNFTTIPVSVTAGSETPNINLQLTITPSGTITGRVTNSTGSPLEGISVEATGVAGSGSATTNSTGYYVINEGLGTGMYSVTASEFGYVDQTQTGVSVTVNQVTPNINFQLQAMVSGRISGRVQTTGTPIIPEFHSELVMLAIFAAASTIIMIKRLRSGHVDATKPL